MMVGSNQRARQFFKQHGWYELGADKIEAKVRPALHRTENSSAGSARCSEVTVHRCSLFQGQRTQPEPPSLFGGCTDAS